MAKVYDLIATMLLTMLNVVESRHCTYIFESGYMKYFYCSSYEYCCGAMCCRSRAITFYQLWYFWLMVILMLLLCSGGGWWYRFRYRGQFPTPSHVAFPSTDIPSTVRTHPTARGVSYPSGIVNHIPPPYPTAMQQPQMPGPAEPPPPYYGPPPSYSSVVPSAPTRVLAEFPAVININVLH